MKKIYLFLILLVGISYVYSQNRYKAIDEFYKRGELFKVIDSDSVQIIVSLKEVHQYGHYYKISLSIANKTDDRVEFIPENIFGEYIFHKKKDKRVEASIISYETYARKVKGHISVAEVFSAIGSSLQALSTAPTGTVSYSDNAGNRVAVNVYDNVTKRAETEASIERMASYQRLKNEFAESEKDFYLLRETLFPQSAIWGYTLLKFKLCHELKVTVKLGGNTYSFNWKLLDPEKDRLNKLTDDMYK